MAEAITRAEIDDVKSDIRGHGTTLYGKDGRSGIQRDCGINTNFRITLTRIGWIIVTPLLTGIGVGIFYLAIQLQKVLEIIK